MSNKPTVNEILTNHGYHNGVAAIEDYGRSYIEKMQKKTIAELSQLVNEIIGTTKSAFDTYGPMASHEDHSRLDTYEQLREEQRTRAIECGFVLENIDE